MSATDLVTVNGSLPRIRSVSFHNGYEVTVGWGADTRGGRTDVVDLAPVLFRMKFYAPLRDDRALMATVHAIDEGTAIAWGNGDLDMSASSVLDLAEQVMTAADFSAFMKRHSLTFDRVAAELGISKRLAGYYAAGRSVPRSIAMACELMDLKARARAVARSGVEAPAGDTSERAMQAAAEAALVIATRLTDEGVLGDTYSRVGPGGKLYSVLRDVETLPLYEGALAPFSDIERQRRGFADALKRAAELGFVKGSMVREAKVVDGKP